MSGSTPWLLALLVVLVVLVWALLGASGRASRRRNRVAQAGEWDAVAVLEARGFTVVARQERAVGWFDVGGEEVEFEVRADFLVEDVDGERYVAEVKTGDHAPDPNHPPTRRQLREYAAVFGLPVLLVDVEQQRVEVVSFDTDD